MVSSVSTSLPLIQCCAPLGDPALTEDEAQPFFQQAVEFGVTFWDTANVYQGGSSEEFVGQA